MVPLRHLLADFMATCRSGFPLLILMSQFFLFLIIHSIWFSFLIFFLVFYLVCVVFSSGILQDNSEKTLLPLFRINISLLVSSIIFIYIERKWMKKSRENKKKGKSFLYYFIFIDLISSEYRNEKEKSNFFKVFFSSSISRYGINSVPINYWFLLFSLFSSFIFLAL